MVGMHCTCNWFYGYLAFKEQILLLIMYMQSLIECHSYIFRSAQGKKVNIPPML